MSTGSSGTALATARPARPSGPPARRTRLKRLAVYAAAGLAIYFLFLLVLAPADWIAAIVARESGGTVRIAAAHGRAWRGEGELIYAGQGAPVALGHLHWRLEPWSLLLGRLGLHVDLTGDLALNGELRLGVHRVDLERAEGRLAASFIPALYPPAALVGPAGTIRFRAQDLSLTPMGVSGQAGIRWQNAAATSLSPVAPLGDYVLRLQGRGETAALKLDTERGDLRLSGEGIWRPQSGAADFRGSAQALRRARELQPLLQLLGNGGAFSLRSVWRPFS